MSFSRPTLRQLQSRIEADISGQLLDGGSLLSRSVLKVLASVWAGACHLMYGFFAWGHRQCFVDTAEAEYLERWARIWGISRKSGSCAAGTLTASGSAGAQIPAGTLFRDSDGGLYTSTADISVSGGTAAVPVQANDTGSAGNLENGSVLSLVFPIAGISSSVMSTGLVGGTDEETDTSLLAHILAVLQAPPHGGSAADYVNWALAVDGVTRAWCYPQKNGVGTVGISFVCDNEENCIPNTVLLNRVRDYITERAPVTASIQVFAPEKLVVNVSLTVSPYSAGLADRIRMELADLFRRESEPGCVIPLSHLREAVSITSGEYDHVITSPSADITPSSIQLPVLGLVTVNAAE